MILLKVCGNSVECYLEMDTLSFKVTSLVEERISLMAPIIHVLLTVRMERHDFTYGYENAHLSFAMAKPSLEPRWKSLYYPLANEVWMAVIAHVFLFPFLLSQVIRIGLIYY